MEDTASSEDWGFSYSVRVQEQTEGVSVDQRRTTGLLEGSQRGGLGASLLTDEAKAPVPSRGGVSG